MKRHDWFRDQLRRVGDHLLHDDVAGALSVFRSLAEAFHAHERAEEEILRRIARLREG